MVALSSWPKIIVSLVSVYLAASTFMKYQKNKSNERLFLLLYFFTRFLGWGMVALAGELLIMGQMIGVTFIKLGVIIIGMSAALLLLLAYSFVHYKNMKIAYIISGIVIALYLYGITLPIEFVQGTFDFSPTYDLISLAGVGIALYSGIFFLKTSFNKELKPTIKKKSLMYGLGILIIVGGTYAATLLSGQLYVAIAMSFVVLGTLLLFIAERTK